MATSVVVMVARLETDPPDRNALERALEIQLAGLEELRGKASPYHLASELNNVGVTLYIVGRPAHSREAMTPDEGVELALSVRADA